MNAKRVAKALLSVANTLLSYVGIQVVSNAKAVEFSPALKRLKALGFEPTVVFDIGVAYGTPDLYRQFKSAKYYLVDPVPQALPYMQDWARVLNASIHNVALGDRDSSAVIEVRPDIGGSTLFQEVGVFDAISKIEIPVRRFDSIFQAEDLALSCLAKIDVQGGGARGLEGNGKAPG
jgi:FkbM family methyltransferase